LNRNRNFFLLSWHNYILDFDAELQCGVLISLIILLVAVIFIYVSWHFNYVSHYFWYSQRFLSTVSKSQKQTVAKFYVFNEIACAETFKNGIQNGLVERQLSQLDFVSFHTLMLIYATFWAKLNKYHSSSTVFAKCDAKYIYIYIPLWLSSVFKTQIVTS